MGKAAFHLAAREGHLPQVQFLHEAGSPLEMADKQGKTALHLAAREGKLMIVEYLLNHGAKIESTDIHGNTPLHFAAKEGHLLIAKLLGSVSPINLRYYGCLKLERFTRDS